MRRHTRNTRLATLATVGCLICGALPAAFGQTYGTASETDSARRWSNLLEAKSETEQASAFSFTYGSRPSAELLPQWRKTSASKTTDDGRVEQSVTYADPATGLEVRVESTAFSDFPAVEWVLYFKNAGTADSPILEDVLPLSAGLPIAAPASAPVLHYAKGAVCSLDDFAPVDKTFEPGANLTLQPGGGRSSSEVMPFFNLDLGGQGLVLAIGWTGEWAATFRRETDGVRVEAGMAKTHLKLHPGEEIRTPRILALFWQGESLRGNNLLRRFLLAHHRPHPNGKPLVLPILQTSWGATPAVEHLKEVERIIKNDLPISLYWIDAEWFGKGDVWWKSNGSWDLRKDVYPNGLRAISDPLHQSGRQFLLWFEPQRVCVGSQWAAFKDRPGWLLELGPGTPEFMQHNMDWKIPHDDPRWVIRESHRSQIHENDLLWNMGEPAARRFLTDWLSDRINEFGLDWYREDFNIAPWEFWQHADASDRQGMTEIRYVEGLYAMWDELLRRHPGLAIDNCSSGGRRIDLETIGRSTALWRSDWEVDALHRQCHTFGLLSWVPLNMCDGPVLGKGSEYEWRSAMTAGLQARVVQDGDEYIQPVKAQLEQYRSIQKFFYGDYYPLTAYSQANDAWMAYQLDLPESGEGLVVVLKRPESKEGKKSLRLKALADGSTYELTNLDTAQSRTVAGSSLLGDGLEVELAKQPDSALIRYRRIDK